MGCTLRAADGTRSNVCWQNHSQRYSCATCLYYLLRYVLDGTDAMPQSQTSPAAPSESVLLCVQVLFTPAPCMWLRPKRVDKMSQYPHYSCPVYRTAERRGVLATTGHSTNFVMFVRLPTIEPASHWTLNGVALISSLSD